MFRNLILSLAVAAGTAAAATYYCDPVNGSSTNPGTEAEPWAALYRETNRAFEAGDTVFCMTGEHGRPILKNPSDGQLVFMPKPGEHAQLTFLGFTGSHIIADGFTITGEGDGTYVTVDYLLKILGGAMFNTVRNCSLFSARDVSDWTLDDWNYLESVHKVSGGVYLQGDSNVIENNYIANIRTGFTVYGGDYNTIRYNTIHTFGEDGMFIQNPTTIEFNVIKDALTVTSRHTDGIQASAGTDNVIIRNNVIMHYEGEPGPYHDYMMGASGHNGGHDHWLIENNLLVVTGWVGSQILGGADIKIINNTCLYTPGNTAEPPHLKITSTGSGNVIRNNISPRISGDALTTVDHNISGTATVLEMCNDYVNGDYTLKPGCAAIDAGTADEAPDIDIRGFGRPQGGAVDIGCYEYTTNDIRRAGYQAPDAVVREVSFGNGPVDRSAILSFSLADARAVAVCIYAADGKKVAETDLGNLGFGPHRRTIETVKLAPGLHYYELKLNGHPAERQPFVKR